jgi:hypothetical protein
MRAKPLEVVGPTCLQLTRVEKPLIQGDRIMDVVRSREAVE